MPLSTEELTLDEINEISAGSRQKGVYDEDLLEFVRSAKLGVPYTFQGKKGNSVKTGFEQAVERMQKNPEATEEDKEAARNVQIVVRATKAEDGTETEKVFLIRKDLAKAAA